MAQLVTIAKVLELTGITVTDPLILQAQGVIGLKTGRDLDDAGWETYVEFARDRDLIRKAICYQAGWMRWHPDVFTASDTSSSTADGASEEYSPTGIVLAPLAKMALRRLSWKGTRSVAVEAAPAERRRYDGTVEVPEWTDVYDPWKPMAL